VANLAITEWLVRNRVMKDYLVFLGHELHVVMFLVRVRLR
jgi:hypothetical protein